MDINVYEEYFRNTAERHKSILHNPASEEEGGEAATRHFASFDQDEVVKNLLTTEIGAGPCLFLHDYEWRIEDNGMMANKRYYTGAYMLLEKKDPNNPNSVKEILARTEVIVNDIEAKLRLDHFHNPDYSGSPFGFIDWNKYTVTPVQNIWDGYYGWYVSFPFKLRNGGAPDKERVINAFKSEPFVVYQNDPMSAIVINNNGDPLYY